MPELNAVFLLLGPGLELRPKHCLDTLHHGSENLQQLGLCDVPLGPGSGPTFIPS